MMHTARCGTLLALILVLAIGCGGGADPAPGGAIAEDITVAESEALIASHAGDPMFVILDVRTPAEYAGGHIDGAVNLDVNSGTFDMDVAALDRTDTYLVYCLAGSRSANAMSIMAGLGFEEVYNMLGGITAWTDAGNPVVTLVW